MYIYIYTYSIYIYNLFIYLHTYYIYIYTYYIERGREEKNTISANIHKDYKCHAWINLTSSGFYKLVEI